jgi:abnormal spindle-like microcephaly-associated protein
VKSSKDIAQRLSKLCLAGEGDINRRLDSITKFQLTHSQYPLDDFDYQITNLAIDLRDGVRLTRLIEILSCRDNYSQQLRWPAIGTSQRIHNLSVALTAAQDEGIKLIMENGESINAFDIESGSREKTLFMLWQLISRWKLPRYVENISLRREIKLLRRLLNIRNQKAPEVEVFSGITHN